MRSPRLLPLTAAALLTLSACSDDADAETDADDAPPPGIVVEGQSWQVPFDDDAISICADVAVHGPLGETPVVVRADGSVVELEAEVPDETTVELADDANTRADCVLDDAGEPVVVVELQDRYFEVDQIPASLFVGFDADGTQLWTYDGPNDADVEFDSRGAIAIGTADGDEYALVDVRSGEELEKVTYDGTRLAPRPLSTSLVAYGSTLGPVVGEGGYELGGGRGYVQVDERRAVVETDDGLALLDLETLEEVWTTPGRLTPDIAPVGVDLSTGTVTAFDEQDALIGIDLETGEQRWTSDAEVGLFEVEKVGQGVAVLPNDDFTAQTLVDTETGEVLPDSDGYVIAGNELLVVVSEGTPAIATVDDLR